MSLSSLAKLWPKISERGREDRDRRRGQNCPPDFVIHGPSLKPGGQGVLCALTELPGSYGAGSVGTAALPGELSNLSSPLAPKYLHATWSTPWCLRCPQRATGTPLRCWLTGWEQQGAAKRGVGPRVGAGGTWWRSGLGLPCLSCHTPLPCAARSCRKPWSPSGKSTCPGSVPGAHPAGWAGQGDTLHSFPAPLFLFP